MNYESKVYEKIPVAEVIQPQVITSGATGVLTGAIDMQKYSRVMAVLMSGTLGSSGTLDMSATASATSDGTYTALTGKSITQLVKASNDNDVVVLEVDAGDLAKVGKRYLKFNVVAGTANATSALLVLGVPRNYDADLVEFANVVEKVG
jgi:hypothetical protein